MSSHIPGWGPLPDSHYSKCFVYVETYSFTSFNILNVRIPLEKYCRWHQRFHWYGGNIHCFYLIHRTYLYVFVIAVRRRGTGSGGLVAMATAQPAFNMATAASTAAATATTASPDLVGGVIGGGSSGRGGNQQGQQGASSVATVTIVTSPPSQQQTPQQAIVSGNSVSITAVTHHTLQQVREASNFSEAVQVFFSRCYEMLNCAKDVSLYNTFMWSRIMCLYFICNILLIMSSLVFCRCYTRIYEL